jgi:hypothetical protein
MSLRSFIDRLNTVTEKFGIFNEIQPDREVEVGQIVGTGLWLGGGELPENGSSADIRILFHVHPDSKRFKLTQAEWNRRRFYWWQLVMHELIHRHQDTAAQGHTRVFRPWSTNRDTKAEQEYYGDYDEIETHSHDAALELVLWWPHLNLRQAIREAVQHSGRAVTPTYNYYMGAFAETPDHPAVKIYRRKLRIWYGLIKAAVDTYTFLEMPKLI